jgi:hypothetical protein
VLRSSRDNAIRFHTVDGIVPDASSSSTSGDSIAGTAFMLWDDRGPDHYRLTLSVNAGAAAIYRAGDFRKLIPDSSSDDWLEISRGGKSITVTRTL